MYNETQAKIIQSVSDAVLQPYIIPKVSLIFGPPGTGKSHTVVGLIRTIIKSQVWIIILPGHGRLMIIMNGDYIYIYIYIYMYIMVVPA